MSDLNSAALTVGGLLLVWALVMFGVWWMRRPRPEPVAYSTPPAPRESRMPKLSRKAEPEAPPVEVSAARMARISGKFTVDPADQPSLFDEPDAPAEPAAAPVAEEAAAEPQWAAPAAPELEPAAPAEPEAKGAPEPAAELQPAPEPAIEPPALDEATLESLASDVEQQARLIEQPTIDTPPAIESAPAIEKAIVRLVPQVPPRDALFRTSWLGGRPHLPAATEWPRVDGSEGDFLAQIACTDLPPALWGGLGPRTGSLAFFASPDSGAVTALHLMQDGEPRDPPRPVGAIYFQPHGIDSADLAPLAIRAFPEWPVDIVTVEPGADDPRDAVTADVAALLAADYDIADPAFHPFDWPSMLALADILESRLSQQPLDGAAPDDASDELAQTIADADDRNRDAVQRAAEIVAIIREGAEHGGHFLPPDATAVMAGLHAIRWTRVSTHVDAESGEDRVEEATFPLTRHRPDGDLWVDAYRTILFDHAKHAWCRNADALSAPARAFFEPLWEAMAVAEMPSMGNFPSLHAVGFDDERDVVLLEFPAGGLMSRSVRAGGNLVLAIRKVDLVAGDFSRMRALGSN